MPKASTRLDDAAVFFEFYLKRMRPHNRDVFVTSDRSAVLVVSIVRKSDGACKDNVRSLPRLFGKMSPVEEYFKWVETFRPNVDHRHVELRLFHARRSQRDGIVSLCNCIEDI